MLARFARVLVVLAGLITALLLLGVVSTPATAAEGDDPAKCQLPKATDDDTISILGRICDNRETPPAPVEGVSITVVDEADAEVGQATTQPDGTFEIPLPGTATENLGKNYVVKLDEGSLPEGAALTDP